MVIKLIVGLGNPGQDYQFHRHNVGFWFCDALAKLNAVELKRRSKFFSDVAQIKIADNVVRLVKPNVYMNRSGSAVQSIANFYQVAAREVLVVHDELDILPGSVKLKSGGGHAGHNGVKDIINTLGSGEFLRLRIGIGRPKTGSQVTEFVLNPPTGSEASLIKKALERCVIAIKQIVLGDTAKAMNVLHTKQDEENGV